MSRQDSLICWQSLSNSEKYHETFQIHGDVGRTALSQKSAPDRSAASPSHGWETMTASATMAASQQSACRRCEEMLREQWPRLHRSTSSRVWVVASRCGESMVLVPSKSTPLNDRFGDVRCIATECALLLRAHAASAISARARVRLVRKTVIPCLGTKSPEGGTKQTLAAENFDVCFCSM